MNKDILDLDKKSGPRTCPKCGHQFPLMEFIKRFIMSYGYAKWPCPGCRETIRCDAMKIQMLLLFGLLLSGALLGVLIAYRDLGILNILYFIPGLIVVYVIFYNVKFKS